MHRIFRLFHYFRIY